MKYRIYIVFAILCSFVLALQLTGCSMEQSSASYPMYADEDAIINTADIIVLGEVVKENKAQKININPNKNRTEKEKEDDLVIYTVSDVKVSEVIKGNVKVGDVIQIKQLGDKDGIGNREVLNNGGYYKKGSQFLFFLASFEDILPGTPYETLTPALGQIEINGNKSKVNKENNIFKDGIDKDELVNHIKAKTNKK